VRDRRILLLLVRIRTPQASHSMTDQDNSHSEYSSGIPNNAANQQALIWSYPHQRFCPSQLYCCPSRTGVSFLCPVMTPWYGDERALGRHAGGGSRTRQPMRCPAVHIRRPTPTEVSWSQAPSRDRLRPVKSIHAVKERIDPSSYRPGPELVYASPVPKRKAALTSGGQ